MATQIGIFPFTGTMANVTGYSMNGKHYFKKKSSLSRKRVLTDHRFTNTRRNAKWFAEAVSIAKKIYYLLLPAERDQVKVWYPLRNRAQVLVREGKEHSEIISLLRKEFVDNRKNIFQPGFEIQQTDSFMISPGIQSLADQLAASYAFAKTILNRKDIVVAFKKSIGHKICT